MKFGVLSSPKRLPNKGDLRKMGIRTLDQGESVEDVVCPSCGGGKWRNLIYQDGELRGVCVHCMLEVTMEIA
jgi:hypothetical protein